MDSFPTMLRDLLERRELAPPDLQAALTAMMMGNLGEVETAALLVALKAKGETASEIAAAAQVLREHMIRWDPGSADVLDTCGTGGDGSGTFNISTATALVVAGCGVPVVKHGNRSVSSRTGSADVLAALGVRIDGDADFARKCLREAGFAFCFAPQFHPALKHLAGVRKRLGVPTLFNCLGPLANPAGARHQLLGVGRLDLLDRMAWALAQLHTEHALVVAGEDGLDEVSLSAPTQIRQVQGERVIPWRWTAADFGLAPCSLDELKVQDARESAERIEQILAAEREDAGTRVVLANAATALLAGRRAQDLRQGVQRAREAIFGGAARRVLETLRRLHA